MKERIGCSGAHGFLGSHLIERFDNPQKLGRDGYIPEGITTVFDCGAYGNLNSHKGQDKEIYEANLMRVITELNWLEDTTKYIYVSSSSVGLPKQTAYSLSKKSAEQYIQLQATERGLKCAIMRPYTVVGQHEPQEHLIPTLIRSCFSGEEMPFVGWPVHDFVHVEDVVDALIAIKDKAPMNGEIYEVGSGKQYTNQEVREIVEKITGLKANIREMESARSYDSKDWVSNNERISTLGWKPKRTLEQAIEEMVNEYARTNN